MCSASLSSWSKLKLDCQDRAAAVAVLPRGRARRPGGRRLAVQGQRFAHAAAGRGRPASRRWRSAVSLRRRAPSGPSGPIVAAEIVYGKRVYGSGRSVRASNGRSGQVAGERQQTQPRDQAQGRTQPRVGHRVHHVPTHSGDRADEAARRRDIDVHVERRRPPAGSGPAATSSSTGRWSAGVRGAARPSRWQPAARDLDRLARRRGGPVEPRLRQYVRRCATPPAHRGRRGWRHRNPGPSQRMSSRSRRKARTGCRRKRSRRSMPDRRRFVRRTARLQERGEVGPGWRAATAPARSEACRSSRGTGTRGRRSSSTASKGCRGWTRFTRGSRARPVDVRTVWSTLEQLAHGHHGRAGRLEHSSRPSTSPRGGRRGEHHVEEQLSVLASDVAVADLLVIAPR